MQAENGAHNEIKQDRNLNKGVKERMHGMKNEQKKGMYRTDDEHKGGGEWKGAAEYQKVIDEIKNSSKGELEIKNHFKYQEIRTSSFRYNGSFEREKWIWNWIFN